MSRRILSNSDGSSGFEHRGLLETVELAQFLDGGAVALGYTAEELWKYDLSERELTTSVELSGRMPDAEDSDYKKFTGLKLHFYCIAEGSGKKFDHGIISFAKNGLPL